MSHQLSPELLTEMHDARGERERIEKDRIANVKRLADLARQASEQGASNRAIAPELGLTHTAVGDLLAGRYGGRRRGRPAKN